MCVFKPISISLSPNIEKDDIRLALRLIFQPWLWKKGKATEKLENQFKQYFGVRHAFAFNSGRSGLFTILKSLNLKHGNEVLLQAFTCNAATNPIIWADFEPIYVDCNEDDFNIDIEDLKCKIGPKTKVLMVQHTFGLPANMNEIMALVERHNLILIEDCAHSLGAEYGSTSSPQVRKKVGTFGKVAFFSFSRDKVISSVYGGMVIMNDSSLGEKIRQIQNKLAYPSYCWIFQQLLHPILMNYLILPLYGFFGLGKFILLFCQWLKILSKAVHWKEKKGLMPGYFPKRMPNALAILALNQFNKLEKFNEHRKKIAEFYYKNLKNTDFILPESFPERKNIFLRFSIKNLKAHDIIKKAWQKNILVGDWYTSPVAPWDTRLDKLKYNLGSCPKAEKLSKETLNLPTHINISEKEARKIIDFLLK